VPKKHNDLFGGIANFHALTEAASSAFKGKRKSPGAAAFMANLETEVLSLERALLAGTYRPGGYREFTVRDAKTRHISAAPFRDRVVHHAFCRAVEPVFERGFVYDSYANRMGKGTHRAVDRYAKYAGRYRHVLRCDIYRYFPAIDHGILKLDIRRRVACAKTLWLGDTIIDGSNPQETVTIHFPGDDLFTPFERRRGLPIGNLTSQFFANVYLDGLDHYCKEVLRAKGYIRYVDDFALFHDDPDVLKTWRNKIDRYLTGRRLLLHLRKTSVVPTSEPSRFLGYVLISNDRRCLPEDNVRRFRGRLRSMRDRYRAGTITLNEVRQRVNSWIAHADHADTWKLRHAIFQDGIFDPALEMDFRDGR
jgi:retron-type reverse transcriptase